MCTFPFPEYHEEGYDGWLGVVNVRARARATIAQTGNKKWPHVWQNRCERIHLSVDRTAPRGSRAWHGCGARSERTDVAVRHNRDLEQFLGRYAGCSRADRTKRLEHHLAGERSSTPTVELEHVLRVVFVKNLPTRISRVCLWRRSIRDASID